ncbi:ras-related protein Rab-9A [Chrysoperla carnea]|uniref:ras-related protein Rab-9A n=1 Tax=Chrysoperla carnea TaxID=189513 RepID=UPI001D09756F|nr:ras-related protein Rab-9A [Chrysoperla carnea]
MSESLTKCKIKSQKNTLLKVVILGDGGVGKSCLMNRFVSNQFDEHSFHTIGVEFLNKDIEIDGEIYTLQIWDTAGQERFKTLRTPFYRGTDICLLTYAVNDKTSFRNVALWRNEFIYYADVKEDESFPFIVVGNKCDVPLHQKEVTLNELESWCNENGISCNIETSARTAINVQEAFQLAVRQWIKTESRIEPDTRSFGDTVELTRIGNEQASDYRSSCCVSSFDNDQSI